MAPTYRFNAFTVSVAVCLAALLSADVMYRTSRLPFSVERAASLPAKRKVFLEHPTDVVVSGSSVIAEGFNPSMLAEAVKQETGQSLTAFNFGVSGGSYIAGLFVVNAILEVPAPVRPKLYVLSVSPMEFSCCPQLEVPSHGQYPPAIRPGDLWGLVRGASSFEEVSADVALALFRLQATRPNVLAYFFDHKGLESPLRWPMDGGGGGIEPVEASVQEERGKGRAKAYRPTMMKPHTCDREVAIGYIKSMFARLRAGGVEMAIIGGPQASQLEVNDGDDSIYPEYEAVLQGLGRELGTGFENFRVTPEITDAEFIDGDHLNRFGAIKFARALAQRVVIPRLREGKLTRKP